MRHLRGLQMASKSRDNMVILMPFQCQNLTECHLPSSAGSIAELPRDVSQELEHVTNYGVARNSYKCGVDRTLGSGYGVHDAIVVELE